jgi:hypothetical protein
LAASGTEATRVQVRRAADPGHLAALGQLGRHGDRVGRFTPGIQIGDGVEDDLVRSAAEVIVADRLADVGDGVLAEHHRAQHALRSDVVRVVPGRFLLAAG